MFNGILTQVIEEIKVNPYRLFNIKLVEITDVKGFAQPLVFVCYIKEVKIIVTSYESYKSYTIQATK